MEVLVGVRMVFGFRFCFTAFTGGVFGIVRCLRVRHFHYFSLRIRIGPITVISVFFLLQ
ncbi:hypothetical protein BZA77DRAFT_298713 [Pyronema omphalodes]|nr:hypothetical protein BZA77DRAFT_298713 [Pyronema omphalodes]